MEQITIDLIPNGKMPMLHASQYDDGRAFRINLTENRQAYTLTGNEVLSLAVRKADNTLVTMDIANVYGGKSYVEFSTTEQMCAVAGLNFGELTITNNGTKVGSLNFYLACEPSPEAGGLRSASEINNLNRQIDDYLDDVLPEQIAEVAPDIIRETIGDDYYDKTETDNLLGAKANTEDVNAALASKANTSDVNASLALKANASDVNAELALKVNKSEFYEVAGSTTPVTPIKISKLNFVKNGTEFKTQNDYETYYIPVRSGLKYVWTSGKLSGNPYLRFIFSSVIPANAVPATYLNELQIVNDDVTYEYSATQNGYLCMAVYTNNVSVDVMTITENYSGKVGELEDSVKNLERVVLPSFYLAYSGDKIDLNKQIIKIKELLNFVDDSAIIPLTTWNGGLALYKNLAFITYNAGYICCFDLNTNKIVASGRTAVTGAINHANNAVFDYEASYSVLPPVYISRCNEAGTECYVESLSVNLETGLITSTLIQTITYSGTLWNGSANVDWCIDCDNRKLIMLTDGHIAIFNLPSTSQSNVTLTDADIISQTTYPTDYVRQGSCVYLGKLYLLTGFSNEAQMRVIDLTNGSIKSTINIKDFTPTEPEGLCVYDNKIYIAMNNGAHGASVDLYEVMPFEN